MFVSMGFFWDWIKKMTKEVDEEKFLLRNTIGDRFLYIILFPIIMIFPYALYQGISEWNAKSLSEKVAKFILLDASFNVIIFLAIVFFWSLTGAKFLECIIIYFCKKSLHAIAISSTIFCFIFLYYSNF